MFILEYFSELAILTHKWQSFFFLWFLRYNLRVTPIAYRLIGETLIRNFFDDPFFFKSKFLPYMLNIAG